jgi:hypothetical protein
MLSVLRFILFSTNLFFLLANGSKIYFTTHSLTSPGALTFLGLGLNAVTCLYFLPSVVKMFWQLRSNKAE